MTIKIKTDFDRWIGNKWCPIVINVPTLPTHYVTIALSVEEAVTVAKRLEEVIAHAQDYRYDIKWCGCDRCKWYTNRDG